MIDIGEQSLGIVRMALAEDLGDLGDITTAAVCPAGASAAAAVVARGALTVAGGPVARKVFELAPGGPAEYTPLVDDGQAASPGFPIARVEGPLAAVLAGERTALNFLCHLCGIATLTSRLVEIVAPYGVKLLDTRKTGPGLRPLEKYAHSMGGGTNHRMGLFDGVLIKDNHIAAAGGLEIAVRRAREAFGLRYPIEVEATSLAEVREALDAGADVVMLDNMPPSMVADALAVIDGRAKTEVSGGITPDNLARYAKLGPDSISLGFITHSAPASDLSLEIEVR